MGKISEKQYVMTISCPDTVGIVAAVSGFLSEQDAFIIEASHFGAPETRRFFMRVVFSAGAFTPPRAEFINLFLGISERFQMIWEMRNRANKKRILIMVSKFDHCLNDLLYRFRTGELKVDIPAIVSNHPDLAHLADWHGIPFHHIPTTRKTTAEQESRVLALVRELEIDLVVLARYMQILSPKACRELYGRCINIHHSFLPGFKGAKPYHQAHKRGVKLIGASAHYVTESLDDGPIIEQAVERVDHTFSAEDLVIVGRDIENIVLSRAVRFHIEDRVLINGNRTVVFR